MKINVFLAKVILLFTCLTFHPNALATAQLSESDLLHDFYDRRGIPITAGQVVNLTEKEVTVLDGNQSKMDILISQLSKRDKDYIRWLKKEKLNDEKNTERATELAQDLEKGSNKLIIRRLNELENLGNSANHCASQVLLFTKQVKDNETRNAAFYCYLAICPSDKDTFDKVIDILKKDKHIYLNAKAEPTAFLKKIPKFGLIAEPILIHTAFTGEVDFDYSKLTPPLKPKIFATTSGVKNQRRADALASLSTVSSLRSHKASYAVIEAAGTKINGQFDQNTIRRLLVSWCDPSKSCPNRSVLDHAAFGNKYKNLFPKEVKAWSENSERWERIRARESQIKNSSKMRNFYDRKDRFITRGSFLNTDQGKVIISSYLNETVSLELSKLSDQDQKWIESKLKN
ncbi:hypothetical protein N9066_00335 [bacterium]|nr:hypothetical protein [bacterium]